MPTRIAIDSSVALALIGVLHPDSERTRSALDRRLSEGASLIVPAHALLETYSVSTRWPPPARLEPAVARRLIRENFGDATAPSLTSREYWRLVDRLADEGVTGGQTYDALIAACARKGGATVLLTWNVRHFRRFADDRLTVATPTGDG